MKYIPVIETPKEYREVLQYTSQYKGPIVEQWEDAIKVYRKTHPDYKLSEKQLALKDFGLKILWGEL